LALLGTVVRFIGVGGTALVVVAIAGVVVFWLVRRRQAERAHPASGAAPVALAAHAPPGPQARRRAASRSGARD
ncbi:MAG: hypothetical protein ACRDID_02370, partial [Ktedonobacterales bacterium]